MMSILSSDYMTLCHSVCTEARSDVATYINTL